MRKKGFTLIELLVVIAIIAILASIVIAAISKASANSRDSQRLINLKNLQVAVERYYDVNNRYPSTGGNWQGLCSTFNYSGTYTTSGPNGYIPNLAPTYIPKLPVDPRQTAGDCYIYKSDGINYMIMAYQTVEGTVPAQYQRPSNTSQQDYAIYTSGAATW